ncbi:MAG: lipoyl synthase [Planctomycetota bacterium]
MRCSGEWTRVEHYAMSQSTMRRLPSWIRTRPPGGGKYADLKTQLRERGLATVCEEARCPNVHECWSGGTATIMVMGEICTRGCRFCSVTTGRPDALDPEEPRKTAEQVELMQLTYVVITSVDRDDLADEGAGHYAACIRATKVRNPGTMVEVLIPDFSARRECLETLCAAGPDVVAHNLETVERLTHPVRDIRAGYRRSLDTLRIAKELHPALPTKSSLMLGLGETAEEVAQAMDDLRAVGVDFLTLGQYLRPTPRHLPVTEFITPDGFAAYQRLGEAKGFRYVASGPLVRSSYKAGEFYLETAVREARAVSPHPDTASTRPHEGADA